MRRRALVPMLSYHPISDADPGTTCGNHRANFPRHPGASPGMVFAVQPYELTPRAGRRSLPYPPYKREAGGSNPPAPTKVSQLDRHFETLIGDSGTTAGTTGSCSLMKEACPTAMAASLRPSGGAAPTAGAPGTGAAHSHRLVGPVDLCHRPADRSSGPRFGMLICRCAVTR
jgi:hypothetical protein